MPTYSNYLLIRTTSRIISFSLIWFRKRSTRDRLNTSCIQPTDSIKTLIDLVWIICIIWFQELTLNKIYSSSHNSCTKFISLSRGRTLSLVSWLKGTFAWGSQAQWYGYALQLSGCLKGNARPLSMAAIEISGNCTKFQSWDKKVNNHEYKCHAILIK